MPLAQVSPSKRLVQLFSQILPVGYSFQPLFATALSDASAITVAAITSFDGIGIAPPLSMRR
jgi:hypothetical protein